jgi:hypothetical protein
MPEVRGPVVRVRTLPSGPCIALVDRDSCDVYDLRSGRRTGFIKQALQPAGTMKLISPDGAHLVIDRGHATRALEVWNTRDAKVVATIRGAHAAPEPVGFVGGDQLAVSASDNRGRTLVQVWAVKTGQMLRQFEIAAARQAVALSPTGRFLTLVNANRLHVYDLRDGTLVGDRGFPAPAPGAPVPASHALSFSPDGAQLAAFLGDPTSASARVLVWSMTDGKLVHETTMAGVSIPPAHWVRAGAGGDNPVDIEWLADGVGFRIGGDLFDLMSGKRFYTIPPQRAGELTGRPICMVGTSHVLHEIPARAAAGVSTRGGSGYQT